jgi:hypothetical protein
MGLKEQQEEEFGFDPYSTTSGMWEGGDIEVLDASYGYKADYNDGQSLLLFLECKTDDEDVPETTLQLSCGAYWRTEDDGLTATKDKIKPFGKQSHVGMVLIAAAELDGALDAMREHGTPMEAKTWIGSKWHLEQKEVDYKGDIGKKMKLIPTKFYGYGGNGKVGKVATKAAVESVSVAKKAAGVAKKATGVAKKAAGVPTPVVVDNTALNSRFIEALGQEAFDDLVSIAWANSEDHAAFVEAALGAYEGIEEIVLDDGSEGFFELNKEPF